MKKGGFTLLETIVVVAIIGLTLPVIFAIIFTLMRQQVKIYQLSQTKREGDYLINIMENTIRNRAVANYSSEVLSDANVVCKDESSAFADPYFLDEDNKFFSYKLIGTKVSSDSANPADLTSSKTVVSNFSISCTRNSIFSPPSVFLSFDICYDTISGNCITDRPEEVASLHYQTKIKLRK